MLAAGASGSSESGSPQRAQRGLNGESFALQRRKTTALSPAITGRSYHAQAPAALGVAA
ncbi:MULTISPECIES: hypothetical protein [Sorangium]|uniref:hypothetical protein n=1 Tax=Sorangium TaxID=39643 RepID=UPI0002EF943B|nr:hypothetical protein [Sorangium cellulosum]